MSSQPYLQLVGYKQWADQGLYQAAVRDFDRLDAEAAAILLRILDHIHVADRIFQHHLQGLAHPFRAPRSEIVPDIRRLADGTRETDAWYADYVAALPEADFDQPVDFTFTSGRPARMTRGEIVLHVCLHGAYHRGMAGLVLQKSGVSPNDDRLTDFLEAA